MKKIIAAGFVILSASGLALAQDHAGMQHSPGMNHQPMPAQGAPAGLREGGQAAFAAIGEIVASLEADPKTDWSKVNVEALRRHLVDMDNVMTHAEVETLPIAGGARFTVKGNGATVASIQRMAAGHAGTMNGQGGWSFKASNRNDGALFEVTSPRAEDAAKIRGLGFAGLLTRGDHHRPHHFGMAAGRMVH
jgi:hypothetical protein